MSVLPVPSMVRFFPDPVIDGPFTLSTLELPLTQAWSDPRITGTAIVVFGAPASSVMPRPPWAASVNVLLPPTTTVRSRQVCRYP